MRERRCLAFLSAAMLLMYVARTADLTVTPIHSVPQVHLLHRAVPDGRGRGAAHHLRRAALRAEDGPVLGHAAQQVQLLLRLPHLPHPRHDLLRSP